MNTYDIPVYAGDRIGLEVTNVAMKVASAVAHKYGFKLNFIEFPWGHRY